MKLILTTAVLFFVGGHVVEAQKAKHDTIPQDTKIDEIVVVAYGSQKRETMVGSNTEVKAKQFADRPITSIGQALDGASAGVKVSTGTGQPGSSPSIQIRGIGSYGISTSPLYVVDGTIYTGSLAAINPNDIASFNILKDAASTSLYGSAAANGVVLITTKSGRKGKDAFNFSMSTGAVGRSIPEYNRVDVYQYYPLIWESIRNGRMTSMPGITIADANNYATAQLISGVLKTNVFDVPNTQLVVNGVLNPDAKLKYTDLDWQKPLMNTGFRQNYELNYSGGSNTTTYFSSVGYTNETGYLIKSDFERFTARLKVDSQVKSWLKLGTSISGVSSSGNNSVDGADNNSAYINPYRWTRTMAPIYSPYAHDPITFATLYDNDGNVIYDAGSARGADAAAGRNVIQETLLNKDLSKNYYIISRAYAEIKVDPYLTLSTNAGFDIRNNRRSTYGNKIIGDAAPGGSAEKYSFTEQTFTWNQLLNYKRRFGDHNFEFLLGHENYKYTYEYLYGYKKGQIVDDNDELINFVTPASLTSRKDNYRKEGVFSRLNYDYKSKYLLSGSIRWDGSSRFAKDVRWDSFWSIGAGWRLKGEEFLSNSNLISELKLRGSYGEVGNDGTNSYFMYKSTYTLGYNNAQEPGILFGFLADPSITWEANKQTDVGVDFGFLNNRITGSVEYYNRVTEDLIFPVPLPVSAGVPDNTISRNVGTMYNRGFEFTINADVIKTQNFTWNITANASTLKNQITELSNGITEIINGTKKISVGHSIYDYWLRQWYGVDPADGSPLFLVADTYANTTAADIRTVNGIKVTTNSSKAKFDYSGTAIPDLFGSFGTSITYKQWSLSALFTYQLGGKTYDSNYAALMSSYSQGGALSTDILDRWTTPGQITDVPALNSITYTSSNIGNSSRWLVSSDFITFRQATLSYSFSPETLSQLGVSGLRILVSGENLWSKTARKGLEPSQAFNGTASNRYTPARVVTIGFNVSF
ncbi:MULTISPECIES: SusC/RagA family TonB-linked outer membrane protein [unclassified Chryseobacterium]|uniref:SusC/RagA family TonB-linked outer membrane protein n=1 Tax=unclassified Chryseobacterium TaxID=2593645 RepID=UPI001B5A7CAD|nr:MULTISPECIES: SusC/RagA family TonB-linked outer membrane protein [unclassified Chryseobacterium]MBP1165921.1 TonB-linked SusC/RagA family outer membrane protein [Chryseobacterium sp. PvR013]MDR4894877.1 SusC/RagA family TonB-linked outer membrane protein [Chryseobacterium sp. CFS7]